MKLLSIIIGLLLVGCSNDITGIIQNDSSEVQHRIYDKVDTTRHDARSIRIMASEKRNPGSITVVDSGDEFTNLDNIKVSDNNRASINFTNGGSSELIKSHNFGFSIPSGATINGIEVAVERRSNPAKTIDSYMSIYSPTLGGETNASYEKGPTNYWPVADTVETYGGATDLWETTWTPSDINNSEFGPVFGAACKVTDSSVGEIDNIYVTIYYTESTTTIELAVNESFTVNDSTVVTRGQDLVQESITDSFTISDAVSVKHTVKRSLVESFTVSDFAGESSEQAAIRCVSSANDLSIRWQDVVSLVESWTRDFQLNKYADGHNSIYLRSVWRKQWNLLIYPNDVTKAFVTSLRTDTNNISLFPLYKYDKSTHYKTRVDNRAPLNYYSGEGDAETFLQVIFYEVA